MGIAVVNLANRLGSWLPAAKPAARPATQQPAGGATPDSLQLSANITPAAFNAALGPNAGQAISPVLPGGNPFTPATPAPAPVAPAPTPTPASIPDFLQPAPAVDPYQAVLNQIQNLQNSVPAYNGQIAPPAPFAPPAPPPAPPVPPPPPAPPAPPPAPPVAPVAPTLPAPNVGPMYLNGPAPALRLPPPNVGPMYLNGPAPAPAPVPAPPAAPQPAPAPSGDPQALKNLSAAELKNLGATDKKAFFEALRPAAEAAEREYGVPAAVTLAQAALETGWGQHIIPGFNIFGIKGKGTAGTTQQSTWEVYGGQRVNIKAGFAKYNNFYEGVEAHGKLFHNGYYDKAMNQYARDHNPYNFANNITGTYATDPSYGQKLGQIMRQYHLA